MQLRTFIFGSLICSKKGVTFDTAFFTDHLIFYPPHHNGRDEGNENDVGERKRDRSDGNDGY